MVLWKVLNTDHIWNKQETTIFIAIDVQLTSEKLNMQNMHKETIML